MENENLEESFIPYKFHDDLDKGLTIVYCRGVENGDLRQFNLRQKSWMIVDPFRYPTQSDEEVLSSLQRTFRTSFVFYDEASDRYLVRDFDQSDFCEDDYKSVSFLPDSYTTKIAMNKKRFYNLFSENGNWTDSRGVEYPKMESHQLLMSADAINGSILFKRACDDSFKTLTEEIWDSINGDIDIIFSDIKLSAIEETLDAKMPNRIDFAWISPHWNPDKLPLDSWYKQNLSDIYKLSFMSSRNLSQVLSVETKKDWEYLTEDMLLSIDLSLFETTKVNRSPKNYCIPGKYKNVYFYNTGDILLRLMEVPSCPKTINIWKKFSSLSKWSSIMSNLYSYERLNPMNLSIPDVCIYMDYQYFVCVSPLGDDCEPVGKVDYMIALSEGSYLTFDVSSKKSLFKGKHPLCQPLFPAVKRSIENYMLCSARNFDVNIEAISDLTDKNKESLRISIHLTRYNLSKHKSLLEESVIEAFETGKIREYELSAWIKEGGVITSEFNLQESLQASNVYIQNVLRSLDKIE